MLPRVRAVALFNYVEVARFVGLDPFAMLRSVRIDPPLLEDPDNWLGARPVSELLEHSARESDRADIAVLLAECRTFASLGPISLVLKHQASLRQIIGRLCEFRKHLNDVVGLELEETDGVALVRWTVSPEFAHVQVEALIAAMGYRALTDAMASSWQPECAHFTFVRPAECETYRRYFQCDLQFSSTFNGLSFAAADLDKRNPDANGEMARHAERLLRLVPTPRETFSDRTKHALYLLLPNGGATVESVSRNLGMGVRSLQRELYKEEVTFGMLLNETRRDLAQRYLSGDTHAIADIAHLIGYSSPSAFSRWFSSEFASSPQAWRARGGH